MGKNSVFSKPLGSTGDNILGKNSLLNQVANFAANPLGGEIGLQGQVTTAVKATGEALGEVTGSNALRKQAMDQASAAEAEAKRQANLSDAMARNAGGDPANIFLGTSRRGRRGGAGGAGSAGTQNSQGTGVQS